MIAPIPKWWTTTCVLAAFLPATARAECYSTDEVAELARTIKALDQCVGALEIREHFIAEQKLSPVPESAWWQEPTVIVSGVVVSFSVGLLIGAVVRQ